MKLIGFNSSEFFGFELIMVWCMCEEDMVCIVEFGVLGRVCWVIGLIW